MRCTNPDSKASASQLLLPPLQTRTSGRQAVAAGSMACCSAVCGQAGRKEGRETGKQQEGIPLVSKATCVAKAGESARSQKHQRSRGTCCLISDPPTAAGCSTHIYTQAHMLQQPHLKVYSICRLCDTRQQWQQWQQQVGSQSVGLYNYTTTLSYTYAMC